MTKQKQKLRGDARGPSIKLQRHKLLDAKKIGKPTSKQKKKEIKPTPGEVRRKKKQKEEIEPRKVRRKKKAEAVEKVKLLKPKPREVRRKKKVEAVIEAEAVKPEVEPAKVEVVPVKEPIPLKEEWSIPILRTGGAKLFLDDAITVLTFIYELNTAKGKARALAVALDKEISEKGAEKMDWENVLKAVELTTDARNALQPIIEKFKAQAKKDAELEKEAKVIEKKISRGVLNTAGILASIAFVLVAGIAGLIKYRDALFPKREPVPITAPAQAAPVQEKIVYPCSEFKECSNDWLKCKADEKYQDGYFLMYGKPMTVKDWQNDCNFSKKSVGEIKVTSKRPQKVAQVSGVDLGERIDYGNLLEGATSNTVGSSGSSGGQRLASRMEGDNTLTGIDFSSLSKMSDTPPEVKLKATNTTVALPNLPTKCDDIPDEQVIAFLNTLRPSVKAAYERVLKRNDSISGKIVVKITVGADGVLTAKLTKNTTGNKDLERRIVEVYEGKKMSVPPNACPADAELPFHLTGS